MLVTAFLIGALASPDFRTREHADRELHRLYDRSLTTRWLCHAAQVYTRDPETRRRLGRLWKDGCRSYGETPPIYYPLGLMRRKAQRYSWPYVEPFGFSSPLYRIVLYYYGRVPYHANDCWSYEATELLYEDLRWLGMPRPCLQALNRRLLAGYHRLQGFGPEPWEQSNWTTSERPPIPLLSEMPRRH